MKWLFDLGLITSVSIALYTIAQDWDIDFLQMSGGVPDWRGRLSSTLGNPNFVGNYIAIWLPYGVLAAYRQENQWKFLLYCLALFVMIFALTLTFCMGAWYALAVLFLLGSIRFIILKNRGNRFRWIRIIVLVLLFGIAVGFLLMPNQWSGHPAGLLGEAKASPRWATGMGARSFIWKTTGMMVRQYPWTGVGIGNYGSAHPRFQGRLYTLRGTAHDKPSVGIVPQVHNEYYQWIAETGLIGGVVLFWLLFAAVATVWRMNKYSWNPERWLLWQGALGGLVVFLLHSVVSFPFQLPANRLVGLLFLVTLMSPACRQQKPQRSELKGKGVSQVTKMMIWLLIVGLALSAARPLISGIYLFSALKGWPVGATEKIEAAILWDDESHENWLYYGQALKHNGLLDEAEKAWQKAARLEDSLMVHQQLVELYMHKGQGAKALREMREILAINPCYPPYLVRLGDLQTMMGMQQEAAQSYKKAQELIDNPQ